VGYITSEVRRREGAGDHSGDAVYEVEIGDYVAARMRPHKILVDCRQAGGQNLGEWFCRMMERCGIACGNCVQSRPGNAVVATSAWSYTIPLNSLAPWEEAFVAPDGMGVEEHVSQVVWACGYRWGFNAGGYPFLDEPYRYVHGVSPIGFTISQTPGSDIDRVRRISASREHEAWWHRLKLTVGRDGRDEAFYWSLPFSQRHGAVHTMDDSFEKVVQYPDWRAGARTLSDLIADAEQRRNWIEWETILRPDAGIGAGMYVLVDRADYLEIAPGTVFQVTEEAQTADLESWTGDATFVGRVVYEP
jgi:hypothetical protein